MWQLYFKKLKTKIVDKFVDRTDGIIKKENKTIAALVQKCQY